MRALVHVGLAALLVLAPALCCCTVRLVTSLALASSFAPPACPSCKQPDSLPSPPPAPSWCHTEAAKPAKKPCCHAEEAAPTKQAPAKPQPPASPVEPNKCSCCTERPDAIPPATAPTLAPPEPTGELLPVVILALAAVPPEHLGLVGGLDPPERAGVDARSEALFT